MFIFTFSLSHVLSEYSTFFPYSSAPELVGLLAELNDALEELENRVNPILSKVSFIFLQHFCL
jgi:hypothetical protein